MSDAIKTTATDTARRRAASTSITDSASADSPLRAAPTQTMQRSADRFAATSSLRRAVTYGKMAVVGGALLAPHMVRAAAENRVNFTTANGQYGNVADLDLGECCCPWFGYGIVAATDLLTKVSQQCSLQAGGYLNITDGPLPQGNLTGACFTVLETNDATSLFHACAANAICPGSTSRRLQ